MEKKYEFVVDHENRTFSFAGKTWNSYNLLKTPKDALYLLDSAVHGKPKDIYQEFNNTYGITPTNFKKCYNGIMRKLWIEPIQKNVMRYAFTSTKKINPMVIDSLWKNKDMIDQCEKDGNENIIPFVVYHEQNPQELKQSFGKSLWKRICKQSMTRNKYIARGLRVYGRGDKIIDTVAVAMNLPSYFLKQGGSAYISWEPATKWVFDNNLFIKKGPTREMNKWINTYKDTQRMASQLDRPFNHSWKPEKLEQKHAEYRNLIMLKKYSPTPYKVLENFIHKKFEQDGYEAQLLDNALAIRSEGETMHHCVGSYAETVARGEYLVYSFKKDGKPSSTLGVYIRDGKYKFSQHYGYCNGHLKDEAEIQLGWDIINKLNGDDDGKTIRWIPK